MRARIGLLLLAVVVVVVFVVSRLGAPGGQTGGPRGGGPGGKVVRLKGYVGGEKMALLADPLVVQALRDRFGLELQVDRRGSIEMVEGDAPGDVDFLWPSSQVALDLYKERKGQMAAADNVLNSPMLLYSWASVADALTKLGVVSKEGATYYVVDMPKLISLMRNKTKWSAIGVPQVYGEVTVFSTDPTKSNSGAMFAGLLANLVNHGDVASEASLPAVLPEVKRFFDSQGFMEQSSDAIFRQYLTRGLGDKPLIVGYEAQMLEYSVDHRQELEGRKEKVRILYPKPTVWSSHPLIAIKPEAKALIAAMEDPDIQKIAWTRHGFRPGSGSPCDPAPFAFAGVPETIQHVMPMPNARTMTKVLKALGA